MVGGVQGVVPGPCPRRTRRNSGKHLRKRKVTSNIQRDAKRRRDQLLQGGCNEQTQDQQKESPGKEVCENRWPCKGMSSPSLERILAGKGPRSPQPGLPPTQSGEPQASSPMASGHCLADTRGSFQLRPPRQRPQRVGTVRRSFSKGLQKSKPPVSDCPQALASRIFWKVAPAPPVHWCFPGAGTRRPAEQRGSNVSWQVVSKGE